MSGPRITIVDYGMGNIHSVKYAFEHLGCPVVVTSDTKEINNAQAIVLPGVGAFGDAMQNLKQSALIPALREQVLGRKVPFLGICLGLQLLADTSDEKGEHQGLGWIKGAVKRFQIDDQMRIPHVGWNDVTIINEDPLFLEITRDLNFYFVHSYHFHVAEPVCVATAHYGETFVAALRKNNIFATQFHPERSHHNGLRLLKNFIGYVERGADRC